MKQNDTVYKATLAVLEENGIEWDGQSKVGPIIDSNNLKPQVVEIVTAAIESGDCDFSADAHNKYPTTKDKRGYVGGMVSNHYRKDKRMNGGETYRPANPGSRVGSGDDLIKNLKLLIKSGKLNEAQCAKAESEIERRKQELLAERSKVEINFDVIPDDLKASLGIDE